MHVLTRLYFGLVCTIISFAARFARKYSTLDSLSSFDVLNTTTHEAFCCQAFADRNWFLNFRNSNEFDAFASSFVWWYVGFAREDPMTNSKLLVHDQVLYCFSANLSEVQRVEPTLKIDSIFEISRCGNNILQGNRSLDQILNLKLLVNIYFFQICFKEMRIYGGNVLYVAIISVGSHALWILPI